MNGNRIRLSVMYAYAFNTYSGKIDKESIDKKYISMFKKDGRYGFLYDYGMFSLKDTSMVLIRGIQRWCNIVNIIFSIYLDI